eukprot:SAG31_NODE_8920_length_1363_cov_1.149525_2_plen_86_part_00
MAHSSMFFVVQIAAVLYAGVGNALKAAMLPRVAFVFGGLVDAYVRYQDERCRRVEENRPGDGGVWCRFWGLGYSLRFVGLLSVFG